MLSGVREIKQEELYTLAREIWGILKNYNPKFFLNAIKQVKIKQYGGSQSSGCYENVNDVNIVMIKLFIHKV